ncbi:hypothetical protein COCCADRAFT_39966 [Bipolaris zeicola 26-R-13]|uniref:Uncharacterized protein n=1 Tax=Cochliobolus carbonum (strain 26-R-13) TaxID=930089 RepID=W6YER8_COCC2|nr:uncharacterized protein COCCADRAFT_39966 [Bipolaris zeicola 26-R-13]EUC29676.1 hypothetical protein COCCADRAFT_39966 [Bipolaris zeicola 26-R-13]
MPPSRYDIATHCSPFGGDGLIPTEHGYFIDAHPGELDTSFFSFTKAELEYINPHQRHLLEVVHECFESAGEANYRGANIGCYVGSFSDDWRETLFHDIQMYGKYPVAIGEDFSVPSRISFEYDLRGPSISTRTACSSALVALTQACTAMSMGECDAAIVAGCQFILTPTMNVILSTRGMLSKDGSCKSFDAAADGYGRGEAINAVYLKLLAAALRDRNPIRGIIRSSAVNDDGKTAGFSIFIGSVKPNTGHSEGASGLTSFIKAILAVEKGIIPPNIRFETPNPKIPFKEGGLTVPTEPIPWPLDRPVRVGINSFGMGGVNAHTVVESAKNITHAQSPSSGSCGPSLLLFSANTSESLVKVVEKNHAYLQKKPQAVSDLAYTLAARRVHLPFRTYSIVKNGEMETFSSSRVPERRPDIVMVFTGQGVQWPGMGARLYETNARFKESLLLSERVLAELPEAPKWCLIEEIHNGECSNIHKAQYAQPVCTAVQVALVDALAEVNVKPSAVGHSSGELAAAYASGRLTAREAINFVRVGAMAAVGMGKAEIEPFLVPGVVVACENSPSSVTISGNLDSVNEVTSAIKTGSTALARQLKVDTSLLDRYLGSGTDSSIPFASSVAGGLEHITLNAEYWQRNLECPVQFNQAVGAILERFKQPLFFLEVGPHSALSGPLHQIFDHKSVTHGYGSCLVGQLFAQDQALHMDVLTDPDGTAQVLADAPMYSWDHSMSNVYAPRSIKEWKKSPFPRHELLGARNVFSTDDQPSWRNVLFFKHVPWLFEHKVAGNAVFPAAGYIAMTIEAVRQVGAGDAGYQIQNLQLSHAMVLDRYNTIEIMTSLWRCGSWYDFTISSHNGVSWVEHCSGRIRRGTSFSKPLEDNFSSDLTRSTDPAKWYQILAKTGVDYGASFQGVRSLRSSSSRLYSSATVVSTVKETVYYPIHPTKMDACFQGVYAASYQGLEWKIGQLPLPTRFGKINILDCVSNMTCNVSAHSLRRGALGASAEAYAADGTMVMTLEDTLIQPLGGIDFVPLSSLVSSPPGWTENAMMLSRLTKACIEDSLSQLEKHGVTKSVSHLTKYHDWLRAHDYARSSGLVLKEIAQQASKTSIGAYATAMGRVVDNIVSLCKGEVDPVELLLSDDTLLEMYDYLNMVNRTPLFRTLGHHHPSQRILEIGAGTGGTTAKILGVTQYSTYTFTDISAAFFPAARSRFEMYPNLIFKTLDITKDPLSQGFLPESFDLIVASNVLHATPSLRETLVNVRRLLHPYGKLLVEELCGDVKYSNIITGVLSGWWAGEDDNRADEPYINPERWDVEMRAAGFNGLDGLAFDVAPPLQGMAYMLTSPNTSSADALAWDELQKGHVSQNINGIQPKNRASPHRTLKSTVLVSDSGSSETAIVFQKQLRSRGHEVTLQSLGESLAPSSDVIVLVDTALPFFHDISASNLSKFQDFLRELQRSHSGALWVTRSSQVGCKDPRYSLSIGVARTSRTEFGVDLTTCELDTVNYTAVALTLDVFEQFRKRVETETYLREMEYTVLIHSASGGVGSAAIQISQMIGAEIYVTVGSDKKAESLMKTYGISPNRIFDSRTGSFVRGIKDATNERGVDLVLNTLSGDLFAASCECVGPEGKLINLVRTTGNKTRIPSKLLLNNTFSARDVQQCLRSMEAREHIGKMLLSMGESEGLPQSSHRFSTMRFKSDASYLLVGGLGGLGRGLVRWMAEHGAAHFVFLSRSPGAEAHKELFCELERKGCAVTVVQGDVSSLVDVEKAISASPEQLKGIFNLSIVLQDGSLLTMSLAGWKAVTQPKYRHSQSLPASAIDVGAVEGIGWTAENTKTLERSKWLESAVMSQQELFQAVTLAILGSDAAKDANKDPSPVFVEPSQLITEFRMTPALNEAFRGKATFLDRRLATYSNRDSAAHGVDASGAGTVGDALRGFIATLPANVDKLDDPNTSKFIAREIAAWVFDLLLKPIQDDDEIDLAHSFVDIGLDSLAAVELRSWWKATLGLDISVLEIVSFANLAAMGDHATKGLRAKFTSAS